MNTDMSSRNVLCKTTKVSNVYIADGFAEDCDNLLQKFLKTEALSYRVFCNIWKDMNFAYIFQGRTSGPEIAELTEEVLIIAKMFMFAKGNSFEEFVGGLFLLYGLVHLQPYKNFAPVRFIPEDVEVILKMRQEALKRKRHDVLYILGSLLIEGPSQFHITQRIHGLETQVKKYFDDQISINNLNFRKGVMYRHTEELDLIRQISNFTKLYVQTKNKHHNINEVPNYINERLPQELESSLRILVRDDTINEDDPPLMNRQDVVWAIKQRAMKDTVNNMRHLRTTQKSKDNLKSNSEDIIKSPQGSSEKKSSCKKTLSSGCKKKLGKARKRKVVDDDSDTSDLDSDDEPISNILKENIKLTQPSPSKKLKPAQEKQQKECGSDLETDTSDFDSEDEILKEFLNEDKEEEEEKMKAQLCFRKDVLTQSHSQDSSNNINTYEEIPANSSTSYDSMPEISLETIDDIPNKKGLPERELDNNECAAIVMCDPNNLKLDAVTSLVANDGHVNFEIIDHYHKKTSSEEEDKNLFKKPYPISSK